MNPKLVSFDRGFVYSATACNAPQPNDSVRYPGHYYAGNTRATVILKPFPEPKNDWTVDA